MVDVPSYLQRIGYNGPTDPTVETLGALTLAHVRTVPFENLDIHANRPIRLEQAAVFAKIVGQRRGGFCYELNGLFAALQGRSATAWTCSPPSSPGRTGTGARRSTT